MKPKTTVLSFSLLAIALCSATSTIAVETDGYVTEVMNVFRSHVDLLEDLAMSPRFKYSDNLVRHAVAIDDTFGMLGPMEWHASTSARIHSDNEGTDIELNEDRFDELARTSRRSIRNLVRAARDSMEDHDPTIVANAVKELKQSCNACHRLLPAAVAPDLWGPLERK